jgi:hypothetical protein
MVTYGGFKKSISVWEVSPQIETKYSGVENDCVVTQSVPIRHSLISVNMYDLWKFEAIPGFPQLITEMVGNPIISDSIAAVILPRLVGHTDYQYTLPDK